MRGPDPPREPCVRLFRRFPWRIELEVDRLPPTANRLLRLHHRERTVERQWWEQVFATLVPRSKRPPSRLQRASVRLWRYSSTCPDPDGLVGSFKLVLDALQAPGVDVLEDDTYGHLGMPSYGWTRAPRGRGWVSVMVEERQA